MRAKKIWKHVDNSEVISVFLLLSLICRGEYDGGNMLHGFAIQYELIVSALHSPVTNRAASNFSDSE